MTIRIGRPEDAPKKEAKQHRCNDRVEDVIQALFDGFGDYKNTLFPAWSVMWKCFKSAEGKEPTDPYIYLKPNNPAFQDLDARRKAQEKAQSAAWNDDFNAESGSGETSSSG